MIRLQRRRARNFAQPGPLLLLFLLMLLLLRTVVKEEHEKELRKLRRGSLLEASSHSLCRGRSAGLLSSRFNHGRPDRADRLQLCTSWLRGARRASLLYQCFPFHRLGSFKYMRGFIWRGLRIRYARSARV